MAILDFLKNKKEKDESRKISEKKVVTASVTPKTEKKEVEKKQQETSDKGQAVSTKFSYTIIKEPHISEKATDLSGMNKYTFKVYTDANKLEIKKSVEGIYKVDVLDVNIIKAPHKKRRLGRTEGFKKAFTKALVTIKEGQKIEIF